MLNYWTLENTFCEFLTIVIFSVYSLCENIRFSLSDSSAVYIIIDARKTQGCITAFFVIMNDAVYIFMSSVSALSFTWMVIEN